MTDLSNSDGNAPESNGQGGDAPQQPRAQGLPIVINVQYLKDLSFENPNAPQSLIPTGGQPPKIDLAVDVQARGLGDNSAEVVLALKAEATQGDRTAFIAEVVYAGVISFPAQLPQDTARALLLIEGPRLLFPFARQILATAVQQGGFPPLMLQPIDFVDIYRKQVLGQGQPSAADAAQGNA
ncbi:MAG: putative protein-export chaperone SecB [Pseudomonadota bacterium]|jgi:preprotein translocase subunit SecB